MGDRAHHEIGAVGQVGRRRCHFYKNFVNFEGTKIRFTEDVEKVNGTVVSGLQVRNER